MDVDFIGTPALAVLISLVPAVAGWWSGRYFAARIDDPALPERLHASRRISGAILGFSLIALSSMAFSTLVWSIPLMLISRTAAAYPLRKVLYQETWSLLEYLTFFARLAVVWLGFWTALACLPMIAQRGGSWDWAIGLVLGVLVLVWYDCYPDVVRFCLRTRPLEEGTLLTRCRALAARCGLPATRFERIDVNGGVIANALALPSRRGSSVLFSSTLLERLDEDEIVAICGHELGHLEHFDARRLQKMAMTTYALVAVAIISVPATRLAGMASMIPVTVLWFGVLLITLVMRAKDKQRQETAADARAVALTGQPEALISALSKLYVIARIPRRIETQCEQADSHPSLARRIRDIRQAAGNVPASLPPAATFTSLDGRTGVTFGDAALDWTDGERAMHRLNYAHLTEIRIDARGGQAPRLIVRGTDAAHLWEMTLAHADVAAAQAVLDSVDARLATSVPVRSMHFPFHRLVATVTVLIAWSFGQIAVAAVTLLALVRPAPQLLAASGVGALTAAALMLRSPGPYAFIGNELAAIIGVLGMGLLWIAYRNRHDETTDARRGIAALAAAASVAVFYVFENGFDVVRMHQSAVTATAAPVLLMSLTGAVAMFRSRALRIAGGCAALTAVVTIVAGFPAFLDLFGRDPFLLPSPPVESVRPAGAMLDEFDLPSWTSRVAFSPDGRYIVALRPTDTDEEQAETFHVGRAGEPLTTLAADDLVFAGNDDLLILTSDEGGSLLKRVPLSALDKPTWRQYLPNIHGASLTFDAVTNRWTATGWSQQRGIVRSSGGVDGASIDQHRWPAQHTQRVHVSGIATSGNRALVVEGRYSRGMVGNTIPYRWTWLLMMQAYQQESRYWTIDDDVRTERGTSLLGADCESGVTAEDSLLCMAFDGSRTRLFTLESRTATAAPIAYLQGHFVKNGHATKGWLTGWLDSQPVAIQLATRQAFLPPRVAGYATSISPAGDRLAVVISGQHGSKVRRYRLD